MTRRESILLEIDDVVTDLLFYDRKEDETLPVGAIDLAVRLGEISVDEIVGEFRRKLVEGLEQ